MNLVGEFRKMKVDGKLCLVYHNVVKPLPQTQTSNSSDIIAIDSEEFFDSNEDFPLFAIDSVDLDDLPHQPLFSCPASRIKSIMTSLGQTWDFNSDLFYKFTTSPFFDDTSADGHHVLPLFWCNTKEEADLDENECNELRVHKVGADYYFCRKDIELICGLFDGLHEKEAVQAPLVVNHPFHVNHPLQLYFSFRRFDFCIFCRKRATYMVYYCAPCDIYMHVLCVQETIPFFTNQPKKHHHTLALFPRQALLPCNVCSFVNEFHLTYVCAVCDFVVHRDCLDIPQTIRMCRHHHRISFVSSLPFKDGSCGVCRKEVDSHYGAYTCNVCISYAVHTRCALRPDIGDGTELEGVQEEDEDVEPFKVIADGVVLHLSHGHHLKLEISEVYDDNKFCQGCALPIYGGNVYTCVECDFHLHETCAEAPLKKFHPLHRHQLKLEVVPRGGICWACGYRSTGFLYVCTSLRCPYQLDIRCALVSEPFEYGGHQHPLFLALDPKEKPMCHVCFRQVSDEDSVLNCIECDFVICFVCATLPYMARYKHDEHYLTFCHGDKVKDSDWCELCEGKLVIGGNWGFYKCDDCSTTLHVLCLLGGDKYLKPGQTFEYRDAEVHVLRNSSSRPTCYYCKRYCPDRIYLKCQGKVFCNQSCLQDNYEGKLMIKLPSFTSGFEQEGTQSDEQQSSWIRYDQEDTLSDEEQSSLSSYDEEETQSGEQQSSCAIV